MSSAEKIIGRLLSKQVEKLLGEAAGSAGLVLIEGFNAEEVFFAVGEIDNSPSEVTVRITDSINAPAGEKALDPSLFFIKEETLSLNRSAATDNFRAVFVMSEQSDRSSLTSMLKINDDNLIDEGLNQSMFEDLIDSAWELIIGPACLQGFKEEATKYLFSLLRKKAWDKPLLRPSARFIASALDELKDLDVLHDPEIKKSLSVSLPELGMFADPHAVTKTDSELADRLRENYYGSNLYRPDGSSEDKGKLLERLEDLNFTKPDDSGENFEEVENSKLRANCRVFVENHPSNDKTSLNEIPWEVASQLFTSKSKIKVKLGDEIRNEIELQAPDRLEEFDDLSVLEGLNSGSLEAAERFMQAETNDQEDQDSLIDLLDPPLIRKIDRLVLKSTKVIHFLPWLIKEIDEASKEGQANGHRLKVKIQFEPVPEGSSDLTRRLFAFLFGSVLRDVAEEAGSTSRFELECDDELIEFRKITFDDLTPNGEEESEGDLSGEDLWPELEFKFQVIDLNDDSFLNNPLNVKWSPLGFDMLKAFFLLSCDPEASKVLAWETKESIYDWLKALGDGNLTLADHTEMDYDSAVSEDKAAGESGAKWAEARRLFVEDLSTKGLSVQACRDYFANWSSQEEEEKILHAACENEFILHGAPVERFNRFMRFDTVDNADGMALLPAHPFKVRWIGEYLAEMKAKILSAMSQEGLSLAGGNRKFFFDSLESLSPAQHPPYFVSRKKDEDERVFHPMAEFGWGEVFKALEQEDDSIGEEVDSSGVETIAKECHTFVQHHLFKKNGTDVLIVLDRPSHFPEEFLEKFYRTGIKPDSPKLRLHILAKPEVLSKLTILRSQEGPYFEHAEEYQSSPFVDVTAYQWEDDDSLPAGIKDYSMDLAIVPALFSSKIEKQENNEGDHDSVEKAYHPLYSKPVRMHASSLDPDAGQAGVANASVLLLPESRDESLYAWSNLSVRLSRNKSLTNPASGTDYMSLEIKLYRASRLMEQLHKASLWVVTLDKYLSRSNIEGLACKPEIVSFKSNLGKNGSYNLIISADMSTRFIKPRLENKLGWLNDQYFEGQLEGPELKEIAEALFKESRGLAPSVVLRSLGGGWTINELMGLVCTKRFLTGEAESAPEMSVWIPLDHNADWFGGATSSMRADLLWVRGNYRGEELHLSFMVVESKFGKKNLARKGLRQAIHSFKAIRSAFGGNLDGDNAVNSDARFWRQSLLEAIHSSGVCMGEAFRGAALRPRFRDDILRGNYKMIADAPRVLCHSPEDVSEVSRTEGEEGAEQYLLDSVTILDMLRDKPVESMPGVPKAVGGDDEVEENDDSSGLEPSSSDSGSEDDSTADEGQGDKSQGEQSEDDGDTSDDSEVDEPDMTDRDPAEEPTAPQDLSDTDATAEEIQKSDPTVETSPEIGSTEEADEDAPDSTAPQVVIEDKPMRFSSIPEERKIAMYEKLINHLKEQVDPSIRAADPLMGEGEGIVEGPSAIRFQIRYDSFVKSKKIESQAEDIASLFMLPEGLEVNVYRDGPYWVLLPKEKLDPVMGSELQRRFSAPINEVDKKDGLIVPLGIDSKGEVTSINMASSTSPHLLIAGQTGGGKSVAVKTFIRGCVNNYDLDEVQLALIDPKGDYKPFSNLSHFGDRYYSQERKSDWKGILEHAVNLIAERIALINEAGVTMDVKAYNKKFPEKKMPRFVLIIDECHNVMLDSEDKPNKHEVAMIRKIGREGRALGVHMVLSTQRPSAKVIDGEIKANVPAVIGLKVKNDLNSRIIIDQTGAEKLMGNGDAIFRNGNGLITRMQVAIFEEDMV